MDLPWVADLDTASDEGGTEKWSSGKCRPRGNLRELVIEPSEKLSVRVGGGILHPSLDGIEFRPIAKASLDSDGIFPSIDEGAGSSAVGARAITPIRSDALVSSVLQAI